MFITTPPLSYFIARRIFGTVKEFVIALNPTYDYATKLR